MSCAPLQTLRGMDPVARGAAAEIPLGPRVARSGTRPADSARMNASSAATQARRAAVTPSNAPKAPSLLPREHGTYGQLAMPLVAALASARPSIASTLYAAAAACAFLAHEPALVLLGHRGPRALREAGARAKGLFATLATASALSGTAAFALSPASRSAAALAALLALGLVPFVVARREKTLGGELLAASALASASLPVLAAQAIALPLALQVWAAWSLGFAASTAAVRGVIAAAKGRAAPGSSLALAMALVLAAAAPALGAPAVLAGAPLLLAALAVRAAEPSPKHLRRVGWTLVATSALTALACAHVARAAGSRGCDDAAQAGAPSRA